MDNKKAANLFQDLLLSLSAGGRLVFCLEYGEGRAALLAVRPMIAYQQRQAGLLATGGNASAFLWGEQVLVSVSLPQDGDRCPIQSGAHILLKQGNRPNKHRGAVCLQIPVLQ